MKIKVYVSTRYIGSTVEDEVEIPDEDLEGMSEQERTDYIEDYAREWMYNSIEWGWKPVD